MFNLLISSGGTSGPRGTGWLSGAGVPSPSVGFDGDFYLDTSNTSVFYGPKTAGAWGSSHVFTTVKSNITATTNPTPSDDSTQQYVVGSIWVNTLTNLYFVCSNVAPAAAVWTPVLPVGVIAGTVAAGNDSRITGALQSANNLSDVNSVPASRTNLGLGNSATLDVGTTAGTVAAGDDSRIVNAIESGSAASGDLSNTYPAPTVTSTHLSSPLPLGQGGTGSSVKNFVDLTTSQSVAGVKTFTGEVNVPAPVNASNPATKAYADAIASGVAAKGSTDVATTGPLPSNTYNNGASGVGATLTATATGTLTVDGQLVALNERVLVKNEASPSHNGIYLVTTAGAVGVAYVLTRSTDMDEPSEIVSAFTFVTSGSVNANTGWIVTGAAPFVIGTTPITWTQFSGAGTIQAGTGLSLVGNTMSLVTPVSSGNLPSGTTSALGIVRIDGTDGDIQPLGTASAGATGKVADAGHVHPTTGVTLHSEAATSVQPGTSFGVVPAVGTALTYSREDHQHGTPSLASSPPAAVQAIGTAAATGVSSVPSRADHAHPMAAAGTPAPSAVGDSTAVGSATTFSASDHVHAREPFGAVVPETSYGQSSSDGSATSVSRSDHSHGTPPLATSAPAAVQAIGTPTATGTAQVPARADHVHPMAAAGTPTTSAVGNVASTGSATTFSASDHVHGRESFGVVTALSSFGASSSDGSASSVSHSDHVHGSPALPVASSSVQGIVQLTKDLGGTSTQPLVAGITGVPVTGTPAFGQGVFANSPSASSWQLNPYMFGTTGVAYGGVMTFHAGQPTQFDISAGLGFVVDNVTTPATPTVTKVAINAQTIDLTTFVASPAPTTRTTNWWLMNSAGVISVQATEPTNVQRRNFIVLGVTASVVSTGVLFNVQSLPVVQVQPMNQLYDLMYSLGPFNVSGNVPTANGANLSFNKSAGTTFSPSFNAATNLNNPHIATNPSETPTTFRNSTQVSGSQSSLVTTMDVTHYDLGGVVTLIPGGSANTTIQRVWLFGTGVATAQVALQYGQAIYSNLADAQAAVGHELYTVNPDYNGIAILIGWILASKSCTSLLDTSSSLIIPAPKFANP